jgi:ribosomal protein S18 acetylase RimI-like enzyme
MLDARDAFTRARLRYLVSKDRVWVARVSGVVAGFCVVVPRSKTASVHAIAVAPSFRRAGVGLKLLLAALGGSQSARCEIRASNFASERLFMKAGFAAQCLQPGVYADGEAAIELKRTARQASPPAAH